MGLKHEARVAALAADVPVVPGSGLLLSVKDAVAQGSRIGFPVSGLLVRTMADRYRLC